MGAHSSCATPPPALFPELAASGTQWWPSAAPWTSSHPRPASGHLHGLPWGHCPGVVLRCGWGQGWPAKERFLQMLRCKIWRSFSLPNICSSLKNMLGEKEKKKEWLWWKGFLSNAPFSLPSPPQDHKSLQWHSESGTLTSQNTQWKGATEC